MKALILLVSSTTISLAQSPDVLKSLESYPDLKSVVEKFDSYYESPGNPIDNVKLFQKTPNGWELFVQNSEQKDSSIVFWSRHQQHFVGLDEYFNRNHEKMFEKDSSFVKTHTADSTWYRLNLFYGYEDWANDVINTLSSYNTLSDNFRYKLARAYNDRFISITWPGIRGLNPPSTDSAVRSREIASAVNYANMALHELHEIQSSNRRFEGFNGPIQTEISNQYMTNFFYLKVHGYDSIAEQFLVPDLYDPFIIEDAKANLRLCDSNAIFFTSGDSFSFPILWLQAAEKYREDVTIIESGLMQDHTYIRYLTSNLRPNDQLKTILTEEFYDGQDREAWFFSGDIGTLTYDELILDSMIACIPDYPYLCVPGGGFKVLSSSEGNEIKWYFPNRVAYRRDLFFFDVVSANWGERPIYASERSILPEVAYRFIHQKGLLYRFDHPSNISKEYSQMGTSSFIANFNWEVLKKVDFHAELYLGKAMKYKWISLLHLDELQKNVDHPEFDKRVRSIHKIISPSNIPLYRLPKQRLDSTINLLTDRQAFFYYQNKFIDLGDKLLLAKSKQMVDLFETLLPKGVVADDDMVQIINDLEEVVEFTKIHNRIKISEKITSIRKWCIDEYRAPSKKYIRNQNLTKGELWNY